MKKSLRWLPAVIAPAVVIGGALAVPAVADAASSTSSKTPAQVLALIADSRDVAYSGSVTQTSDLGLPSLPTSGAGTPTSTSGDPSDPASLIELLTADHTARVYVDGADKTRVQVLDNLAERDVVRNGSDVWTYDSKKNAAVHLVLPTRSTPTPNATTTPADAAQRIVDAASDSSTLAVSDSAQVAGRDVYTLTLTPKTADTLVARAVLSVDAKTGLPLRVEVDAKGQQTPAFLVGFTSIDFSTPDAARFTFTPPTGADVTTKQLSGGHGDGSAHRGALPKPTVTGTGWASVAELQVGADALSNVSGQNGALLDQLTTRVDGGRALQTSLLSVLLTDDGELLAGAVPVSTLEAAAR